MKAIKLGSLLSLLLLPIVSLGMGRTAARLGSAVRYQALHLLPKARNFATRITPKSSIVLPQASNGRKIAGALTVGALSSLAAAESFNINSREPETGTTALIQAVRSGLSNIELLLRFDGVDVNIRDYEGKTALDYAIENGDFAAVAKLAHRTDLKAENREGCDPLALAKMARKKAQIEMWKAQFMIQNEMRLILESKPELEDTPEGQARVASRRQEAAAKERQFNAFNAIVALIESAIITNIKNSEMAKLSNKSRGLNGRDGEPGQNGFSGQSESGGHSGNGGAAGQNGQSGLPIATTSGGHSRGCGAYEDGTGGQSLSSHCTCRSPEDYSNGRL
jgi:uncharacterized membrane protein YgcG